MERGRKIWIFLSRWQRHDCAQITMQLMVDTVYICPDLRSESTKRLPLCRMDFAILGKCLFGSFRFSYHWKWIRWRVLSSKLFTFFVISNQTFHCLWACSSHKAPDLRSGCDGRSWNWTFLYKFFLVSAIVAV